MSWSLLALGLLATSLNLCAAVPEQLYALEYSATMFKERIPETPHFVMFYAPWCGHCKRLHPTWEELAKKFNVDDKKETAIIAKVDCTMETILCSDQGVTGYPTLHLYNKALTPVEKYKGQRELDTMDSYIQKTLGQTEEPKTAEPASVPVPDARLPVKGLWDLSGADFDKHVERGHHFVEFFAPWCGHCKKLGPTWINLAKEFEKDETVTIGKVDCTKSPLVCQKQGVKGYPTLLFFTNGQMVEKYQGARDLTPLRTFVNRRKLMSDPNAGRTDEKVPEKVEQPKGGVVVLDAVSFRSHIQQGDTFIKFYAPWCGHCKRLAPVWDELAEAFADQSGVSIAKVDCTEHKSVCQLYSVKSYPTLHWFSNGHTQDKYSGGRDLGALKSFVQKKVEEKTVKKDEPAEEKKDEPTEEKKEEKPASVESVLVLKDDDFKDAIKKGTSFVKFYAPWCGHCKRLAPTWDELGGAFSTNPAVNIAKVDCTTERQVCKEFEVQGFPTLILFRDGEKVKDYSGGRDINALRAFVTENLPHDEL